MACFAYQVKLDMTRSIVVCAFLGRVGEVLPLPDRLRVVPDVGVTLAAEVTREAAAALGLTPGRALWASVKATAIRIYD